LQKKEENTHFSDPNFEPSFNSTLLPLFSEEYDLHYAYNTLLLKMLTDWPPVTSFQEFYNF
jgi:hypothetical protein